MAACAPCLSACGSLFRRPRRPPQREASEVEGLPSLRAALNFGAGTHRDPSGESSSAVPVLLHDGRSAAGRFRLHREGFELLQAPGLGLAEGGDGRLDLYNADVAWKEFFPRAERLALQHCPGATRAIAFDHIVRNPERLAQELAEAETVQEQPMPEALPALPLALSRMRTGESMSSSRSGHSLSSRVQRQTSQEQMVHEVMRIAAESEGCLEDLIFPGVMSRATTTDFQVIDEDFTPPPDAEQVSRMISRRTTTEFQPIEEDVDDAPAPPPAAEPVPRTRFLQATLANAHGDYTARSGPSRARQLLEPYVDKDAIEAALADRFAILNVWYPFSTVLSDPLALCTWSSASSEDVTTNRLIFKHRIGETYKVKYSPRQRWVFFSEVTNDEAILLKTYDSLDDGKTSRFCLHSAFELPEQGRRAKAGEPPLPVRESLEVRILVLFGRGLETLAPDFVPPHMAPASPNANEITHGLVRREEIEFEGEW